MDAIRHNDEDINITAGMHLAARRRSKQDDAARVDDGNNLLHEIMQHTIKINRRIAHSIRVET